MEDRVDLWADCRVRNPGAAGNEPDVLVQELRRDGDRRMILAVACGASVGVGGLLLFLASAAAWFSAR